MKPSSQNLIQEFKAVFSENVELEIRNKSELKALLPLLADQDFKSDVELKC